MKQLSSAELNSMSKEDLANQTNRFVKAFLKDMWATKVRNIAILTSRTFSKFLSGQCLEACILGGMFAVTMLIFNMPYIPLVSVIIAVTALIPVVGAFVGCIVGAFFILVNDPIQALSFIAMFLVLQQIEGNLIYPRVVGTSVGLPGMWVLLAVSMGGELMGVAGMFLMIPVTSVLYAVIKDLTNKKLTNIPVEEQKLQPQPPELMPKLRTKRKKKAKQEAEATEDNNA